MARELAAKPSLRGKISTRQAKLGIVGLGYVGFPLALEFAKAGFTVTGVDIDPARVANLNRGLTDDVSSPELEEVSLNRRLSATTSCPTDLDVIIVCVPTPLTPTREPDLSHLRQAAETLASTLRGGELVILESTSYPGTTEEVMLPILSRSGLTAGRDYYLGYSPERIDPGNKLFGVGNTPKVVGGLTPKCLELISLLYGQIVERVVPVSSIKAAEMTKLLENIYRSVNIALVNEMAMLCRELHLNIWEIVEAAATKPFGFMRFQPGPGLGGHCLPVDPFYLSWKAKEVGFYTEFIELAGKTNEAMTHFVLEKVIDGLNDYGKSVNRSRILVLGLTYKSDVADLRESPAKKIIPMLLKRGATVTYHDPYVHPSDFGEPAIEAVPLTAEVLSRADCVLILTAHSSVDYDLPARVAPLIIDTRNVMAAYAQSNIIRL